MNRLTNYCGKWIKHGGWYPDKKIRLFNYDEGLWNDSLIHETIVLKNGSPVEHLKGDILHYSYHSVTEHVKQANKFTDLTAYNAFKSGKKSNVFKVIINPQFKFLKDYIIKMGFLDGFYGLVVATISSFATFLKYVKLYQMNKQAKKSKS
jgi:hypothetical protein